MVHCLKEKSDFVEKTNSGFAALHSYYDNTKDEHLECAIGFFRCALGQCGLNTTHRATALCNLATAKFIRCLAHGTYSNLYAPIELYKEILELREYGHPDQPATLLLLAQVLLSVLGQEYDESIVIQIRHLLAEINPDDNRERRTADTILRTCRLYRAVCSEDLTQVGDLPRNLDHHTYVPPYGFFDRPRLLHKLGVTLWIRYQLYTDRDDLDRSIALNEESLRLIPDGHGDQESIVACLGRSFLRLLEVRGDLTDVDMSVDNVKLGERVVTALNNMSCGLSSEELQEQIALMPAADALVQQILQEAPLSDTPELQSLIDELSNKDSIPTICKRQLGVLLSFLRGEGEEKMRKLLGKLDWPFKEHATKETTRILQGNIPYIQDTFAARLCATLANTLLICGSADDALTAARKVCSPLIGWSWISTLFFSAQFKLPKFHILRAMCDTLERNGRIREAIACFQRMKSEQAKATSSHDEREHWERGGWLLGH